MATGLRFKRKAFTQIELLVAAAILTILAAIAVPNYLEAQARSKISRAKADIRIMVIGLDSYAVDNHKTYPDGFIDSDFNLAVPPQNYFPNVTGDQVRENFKRLTTPVAYLAMLPPITPFGNSKGLSSWNTLSAYRIIAGQTCTNILNGEAGSTVDRSWANGKCLIYCLGPTKQQYYEPLPNNAFRFAVYDPTNGVMSPGQIVYVGSPTASYHSFQ